MFGIVGALKDAPPGGIDLEQRFIQRARGSRTATPSSGTGSGRSPTRPSATWALAYAVGLVLIYLLVVAQFGSYACRS